MNSTQEGSRALAMPSDASYFIDSTQRGKNGEAQEEREKKWAGGPSVSLEESPRDMGPHLRTPQNDAT